MRRLWCALAAGEGRIRIRATAFARLPMLRIGLTAHPVKPLQAKGVCSESEKGRGRKEPRGGLTEGGKGKGGVGGAARAVPLEGERGGGAGSGLRGSLRGARRGPASGGAQA